MVACYARVSTTEQAQNGYSIDEQQDRLRKYCEAMGWDCQMYVDGGFSGSNTDRPALQQLIRDVKSGAVEKVLVYKLDRLSRSQKDTLMLIEDTFLRNGCDFVSMNENFDTSTPLGRAMIGILAVFAQLEREQIRERMIMGKDARAKQGKYHGADRNPIGYDYIDGELVVNEFEKLQVQQIFNDYAAGFSVGAIAKRLNEAGMTHKHGKWSDVTVRRILQRKIYLGYINHHDEWIPGNHQPIIEQELFDSCGRIMESIHLDNVVHGRRHGKATSLLGGFLFCAECGNRYSHKTVGNKEDEKTHYAYYGCNTRIRKHLAKGRECSNKTWHAKELEDAVFGEIRKLRLEPSAAAAVSDDTETLSVRIVELQKQIERLIDLYAVDSLSRGTLEGKIKALNDQKIALEKEIERIRQKQQERLTRSDAVSLCNSFDSILDGGDFAEIRSVLSALIEKIVLDGDNITIFWKFY